VGRRIDLDDLLDLAEVAELLGLGSSNAVATYRHRAAKTDYPFPQPIKASAGGRCQLWLRADIEAWRDARA
jgi:predicted DNA-binding transcriptional regulator AlpA